MKEVTATLSAVLLHPDRPLRLLTRIEARERLGNISDDKLYSLISDGVLPPPIKLGTCSRWLESDLDAFITALTKDRQTPQTPPGIRAHHAKLAAQKEKIAEQKMDEHVQVTP